MSTSVKSPKKSTKESAVDTAVKTTVGKVKATSKIARLKAESIAEEKKNAGQPKEKRAPKKEFKAPELNYIPLISLGNTNVVSGRCKHFNLHEEMSPTDQIEIWEDVNTKGLKLIITEHPTSKVGDELDFMTEQKRFLFKGKLVKAAPLADAKDLRDEMGFKNLRGYAYSDLESEESVKEEK